MFLDSYKTIPFIYRYTHKICVKTLCFWFKLVIKWKIKRNGLLSLPRRNKYYLQSRVLCVCVCVFYGMSLLPFIAAFQNPKYCRVGMVLLQICKYVCVSSCLHSTWERGRGLCRVNWWIQTFLCSGGVLNLEHGLLSP